MEDKIYVSPFDAENAKLLEDDIGFHYSVKYQFNGCDGVAKIYGFPPVSSHSIPNICRHGTEVANRVAEELLKSNDFVNNNNFCDRISGILFERYNRRFEHINIIYKNTNFLIATADLKNMSTTDRGYTLLECVSIIVTYDEYDERYLKNISFKLASACEVISSVKNEEASCSNLIFCP